MQPQSVIKEPSVNGSGMGSIETLLLPMMASISDGLPAWGTNNVARERALREFWPTEPVLAGALFSTAARYAAFGWTLTGGPRSAQAVRDVFNNSQLGMGWMAMILPTLLDLFTQDNGAFIETVRADEDAPCVQLNHLDSARCIRTGNSKEPVQYMDLDGKKHLLKGYEVIPLAEFPSPDETKRGMQYCVVTRLLRAAQILRDIAVYKHEKISGRFTRAIHIVSGVSKKSIDDAVMAQQNQADSQGLIRYMQPVIVASLDPTANVTSDTIDLASLPDGFDEEKTMKWYIDQLALAFGGDYQDYAPLPGGNLGTAQQSEVLHLKGRGKGPALFMRMLEQRFNFHGVMPRNITFQFGEQDTGEDASRQDIRKKRAETLNIYVTSGILTPEVALQVAVDAGDLDEKYLTAMGAVDLTETIALGSSV